MQIFSLSSKKRSSKKVQTISQQPDSHHDSPSTSNEILSSNKKTSTPIISYYDIRLDSPYKDLILIQGTPLETVPITLSGKLIFSINEDVSVKRIKMRLAGNFKLEFLQMSRYKGNGGLASIVKEQKPLIECQWDNLLHSSQGKITINNIDNKNTNYNDTSNPNSTDDVDLSDTNTTNKKNGKKFRIKTKQKNKNIRLLELPEGGFSGTPFPELDTNGKYTFLLRKGNYELPFTIQLPSDIPETVEGLQSSSILYSMEGTIERRKKSNMTILNETDKQNLNAILSASSSIISSGYESNLLNQSLNIGSKIFTKYKYLRVLRTLSSDNLALQEEMTVGNTLLDKLQYEIKIPSLAIPIGGRTPIQIKIFPFQKNYKLMTISTSLIQLYSMKDSDDQIYEDEVIINKQSMTNFGNLVEEGTNRLTDKFELISSIQLPDDLRGVTQDCSIKNNYIHVHHKLQFNIILKRSIDGNDKNLEIKASLPILLFVSPQIPMKGRLVLYDQMTGKIHFRAGKFVPLFPSASATTTTVEGNQWVGDSLGYVREGALNNAPPPNYQERTNDQLIQQLELTEHPSSSSSSNAVAIDVSVTAEVGAENSANDMVTETNGNGNTATCLNNENYTQPPPLWDNEATIPEYTETP